MCLLSSRRKMWARMQFMARLEGYIFLIKRYLPLYLYVFSPTVTMLAYPAEIENVSCYQTPHVHHQNRNLTTPRTVLSVIWIIQYSILAHRLEMWLYPTNQREWRENDAKRKWKTEMKTEMTCQPLKNQKKIQKNQKKIQNSSTSLILFDPILFLLESLLWNA